MARRSNSQTYLRPRSGNGRFRSALAEIQEQNACYQEQLIARERALLVRLAGLSPSRLAWYEDNDNVPAYGNTRLRVETLEPIAIQGDPDRLASRRHLLTPLSGPVPRRACGAAAGTGRRGRPRSSTRRAVRARGARTRERGGCPISFRDGTAPPLPSRTGNPPRRR